MDRGGGQAESPGAQLRPGQQTPPARAEAARFRRPLSLPPLSLFLFLFLILPVLLHPLRPPMKVWICLAFVVNPESVKPC